MCEFNLKLADVIIGAKVNYDSTRLFCEKYTVEDSLNPDFTVVIDFADITREREKSYAEDDFEGKARREFSDAYLETLALYRKIADGISDFGVILFHGSVISVDGVGYLFTAKSGTGKSTHTRLWRELFGDRAVMVNDDKPLISVKNSGGATVYGTPWCGKHSLGENISVPLRSVCILERAKENTIAEVDSREVYPLLLQQTYRSTLPDKLMKIFSLLDELMRKVKIYRLGCNMELDAARISYAAMSKDGETH